MSAEAARSRRGLQWPMRVDDRGNIALTSGADHIRHSIWVVLSTEPGERVMRPDFGTRLHDLFERGGEVTTMADAGVHIREALDRWVVGAIIEDVTVKDIDSIDPAAHGIPDVAAGVEISVVYVDRATRLRHTVVYSRLQTGAGRLFTRLKANREGVATPWTRYLTADTGGDR